MPEKLCIICGKIPTNHPSGKCVMCLVGERPLQASQRELQGERIKNNKEGGRMAVPKNKQCKREDCEKYAFKGGMCLRHFNEAHGIKRRVGRKPKRDKDNNATCSTEGCGLRIKSGGLCNKHYLRKLKEDGRIGKKTKRGSQVARQGSHKPKHGSHKPKSAGSIPAPATNFQVSVDLDCFPKIYKFITALPEISAFDMLGVLLKSRLNELEERITI